MIVNEKINELVKKFRENKLSHVFLVETNNKDAVLKDLLELIKIINCPKEFKNDCTACNLCHLIDTNCLPSLKIIYPDGQAIKEYQMSELKKEFSSVPYLSKYSCYIINDVEKFNASSANSLLKFIEEPEPNIIGFLVTNNKENVINTIKSRCEIIRTFYEKDNISNNNEKILDLAQKYLSKLEIEKIEGIVYNKIILDENLDKEEIKLLFKIILDTYLLVLNKKDLPDNLKELYNLSNQDIIKRVNLINVILDRLNYNININLILDYFVLGLED